MLERLRRSMSGYPRQLWIVFWGMLISAAGGSMVWPFLTIYLRQRLELPLTTVTLVLTFNSIVSLLATSVAGPAVDRFGRRGAMLISLGMGSLVSLGMSVAGTLPAWFLVMGLNGLFSPLMRVGSSAMVADLVPPEKRAGAYALLRMGSNTGVAIGPAIGGYITTISYSLAFYGAAAAALVFTLVVFFFVAETIPPKGEGEEREKDGGYGKVLRDRPFLLYIGAYALTAVAYSLLMVLLPVYGKENFGVAENQYGFIMATNAAMVVFLQYMVTRVTSRYRHLPVLAAGAIFVAVGVGSVAWGSGFTAFLVSMIVLTIGEMIIIPTSTALTANLAPPDMRGRYMGVYGLTWSIGFGVGPVLGGLLNDYWAPRAVWYGGFVIGLLSAVALVLLDRVMSGRIQEVAANEVAG